MAVASLQLVVDDRGFDQQIQTAVKRAADKTTFDVKVNSQSVHHARGTILNQFGRPIEIPARLPPQLPKQAQGIFSYFTRAGKSFAADMSTAKRDAVSIAASSAHVYRSFRDAGLAAKALAGLSFLRGAGASVGSALGLGAGAASGVGTPVAAGTAAVAGPTLVGLAGTPFAKAAEDVEKANIALAHATQKYGLSVVEVTNQVQAGTRDMLTQADSAKLAFELLAAGITEDLTPIASDILNIAQFEGVEAANVAEAVRRGINTGRGQRLQTLGIGTDFTLAYENAARELGITTDQLTAAQQKQIRTTEILNGLQARSAQLGDQVGPVTQAISQFGTTLNQTKTLLGQLVSSQTVNAFKTFTGLVERVNAFLGRRVGAQQAEQIGTASLDERVRILSTQATRSELVAGLARLERGESLGETRTPTGIRGQRRTTVTPELFAGNISLADIQDELQDQFRRDIVRERRGTGRTSRAPFTDNENVELERRTTEALRTILAATLRQINLKKSENETTEERVGIVQDLKRLEQDQLQAERRYYGQLVRDRRESAQATSDAFFASLPTGRRGAEPQGLPTPTDFLGQYIRNPNLTNLANLQGIGYTTDQIRGANRQASAAQRRQDLDTITNGIRDAVGRGDTTLSPALLELHDQSNLTTQELEKMALVTDTTVDNIDALVTSTRQLIESQKPLTTAQIDARRSLQSFAFGLSNAINSLFFGGASLADAGRGLLSSVTSAAVHQTVNRAIFGSGDDNRGTGQGFLRADGNAFFRPAGKLAVSIENIDDGSLKDLSNSITGGRRNIQNNTDASTHIGTVVNNNIYTNNASTVADLIA